MHAFSVSLKALNVLVTAVSFIVAPTRPAGDPSALSPIGIAYDTSNPHHKPTMRELGIEPPAPFSEGN